MISSLFSSCSSSSVSANRSKLSSFAVASTLCHWSTLYTLLTCTRRNVHTHNNTATLQWYCGVFSGLSLLHSRPAQTWRLLKGGVYYWVASTPGNTVYTVYVQYITSRIVAISTDLPQAKGCTIIFEYFVVVVVFHWSGVCIVHKLRCCVKTVLHILLFVCLWSTSLDHTFKQRLLYTHESSTYTGYLL